MNAYKFFTTITQTTTTMLGLQKRGWMFRCRSFTPCWQGYENYKVIKRDVRGRSRHECLIICLIKQYWPHQVVVKPVYICNMLLVPGNKWVTCLWTDSEGEIFSKVEMLTIQKSWASSLLFIYLFFFLPLKTVYYQLRSWSHQVIQSLTEIILLRLMRQQAGARFTDLGLNQKL